MSNDTGGYISDVSYVAEFYGDHAPAHINLVAATNGFAPRPLDQPFTWCDYGCGNGITAVVLAGAFPQAQFYGVDFMPVHIRTAETLAMRAGLTNTTFLQKSFSGLAKDDLPALDFAVMHGVLSWIDEPTRAALLDDAAQRLKPGGLLLTGTNAMPGWAAKLPMRNMVYSLSGLGVNSLERARIGLEWLKKIKKAQVKYFRDNPALAEAVEELDKLDPRYMAHEYFNENLRAFYFAELKAFMEARGLKFAGSARLFLNMVDLAVPQALQDEFRAAKTRAELEAKRDFIRNETFRRDVWIKGDGLPSTEAWDAINRELVLGTLEPLSQVDRKVAFGDIQVSYENGPLAAMLKMVGFKGLKLSTIAKTPEFAGLPPGTEVDAARLLAAGGQVMAFPAETRPVKVKPNSKLTMPMVNRSLIKEIALRVPRVALAAVHAGTGIEMPNIDAILLLARCEHGRDGAVKAAAAVMSGEGGSLVIAGKPVTAAEMEKYLAGRLSHLESTQLDKLAEIGVISLED